MKQLLFLVILTITIIGIESYIDYSSPEYLSFVEAIKKHMNNQTHPCDDFYEYSCGNWDKHHEIPEDEEIWDIYDVVERQVMNKLKEMLNDDVNPENTTEAFLKARKMYRSCMNLGDIEEHGLNSVLHYLNKNGGWPLIMGANDWTSDTKSFYDMHVYYERYMSLDTFYSFGIGPSSKNSSENHFKIAAPSVSNLMTIVLSNSRNSSKTTQMIGNLTEMIKILVNASENNFDAENVKNDINDLVDFIYHLAELVDEKEENAEISMVLEDFVKFYNNHSSTNNSKIISREFFDDYFFYAHTELWNNDTIAIIRPNYLLNVTNLLDSTPLRTLVNYMKLNLLLEFVQGTPKRLRDFAFKLEQIKSDIKVEPEREMRCIEWLHGNIAVNHEYVRRYADPNITLSVNEMFVKMFAAANEILKGTPWLSHDEAEYINQKLSLMKRFISHPDWYEDSADVDRAYSKYKINNHYIHNMIEVKNRANRASLNGLYDDVEKNEMESNPVEVNAGYYHGSNNIDITLGILQPPFFSLNYPQVFQYAALGEIIGHEISHAFDGNGIQYDAYGNKRPWFSNNTLGVLNSKVECYVNQFNKYKMYDADNKTIYMNGAITKNENIADLYGLKIAYRAHKNLKISDNITLPGLEKFSADQIFFLAHSLVLVSPSLQVLLQQLLWNLEHIFLWNCGTIIVGTFDARILTMIEALMNTITRLLKVTCGSEKLSYLRGDAQREAHAIPKYRINGCVSNMEEFSTAFNCPVNRTMNPSNKCSIWGSNN